MVHERSYFSVMFDLISVDRPLPYDLFVNSSKKESKEKFVRIFPIGETLSSEDRESFKKKYHQLYIPEDQRSFYLQSLATNPGVDEVTKTELIKDSAIQYLNQIFDPSKEFTTELLNETIEGCRDSVEAMVEVVKDKNIEQMRDLIASLSFHDFYTFDHSINVSMYCISILRAVKPNATKDEFTHAGMGGLLHDLGKIQIPTDIINSPGKLTDEQFAQIKAHPQNGKNLIEENSCSCEGVNIDIIKRVVYEHHENFNGTGYPNGIQGDEIHLYARITAIADFFDAITTKRSYHDVMPIEEALHVMAKSKGKKIDPRIFDIFAKNAQVIIKQNKGDIALPDDFDPCQPHEALPFEKYQRQKEEADFGKIKLIDRMKPKKKSA